MNGTPLKQPKETPQSEPEPQAQRSGFINVKALASINDMSAPTFDFSDTKEDLVAEVDFERALEESIQNPKTEVVEKVDTGADFEQYLSTYNPQNDIDRLIVAGMYILNIENKEMFTIKELNAKLVPATGSAVDHATIDEAIKQNLVRIVPDLTQTSEYTQYTLTDEGENYFIV